MKYTDLFRIHKIASYENIRKVASLIKRAQQSAQQAQFTDNAWTRPDVRREGIVRRFKQIYPRQIVGFSLTTTNPSEGFSASDSKFNTSGYPLAAKPQTRFDRYDRAAYVASSGGGLAPAVSSDSSEAEARDRFARDVVNNNIAGQKSGTHVKWSSRDLYDDEGNLLAPKQVDSTYTAHPEHTRKAMKSAIQVLNRSNNKNTRTLIDYLNVYGKNKKPGTSNTTVV